MSKSNKGYLHNDPYHRPRQAMSRRELMAQGFLSASGMVMMPSLLAMITGRAYGATDPVCSSASATRMVPVLIFDLVGGGNIAGTNVMVGAAGGQTKALAAGSYATIGLAPTAEPGKVALDTTFGLAFHPASKMLAGMKAAAPTVVATPNVDGVVFCTATSDDTTTNPLSPLYFLAKGGLSGSLVNIVGTDDGASGGHSAAPADSIDPSKQPSTITQPSDAQGLVDAGTLGKLLTPTNVSAQAAAAAASTDVNKVLAAIKTMSDSRVAQFSAQAVPQQIQDLIRCGYINASSYLANFTPAKLDPTQDAVVTGIYQNIANDPNEAASASIAKLVLDGYAGAGVVSLAGFDYHGQGRTQQDAQDTLAGTMIGLALELAAQKKQPLMIYVYTDGGVAATPSGDTNGIYAFTSDSGQRSSAFSLVYNPSAKPVMATGTAGTGRQVGAFSSAGAVDTSASLIGSNIENQAKAFAANWLALHGLETDATRLTTTLGGASPFGTDLSSYVAFTKLT